MEITQESIAPNKNAETDFWNFVAHRHKLHTKRTWYPHEPHFNPNELEILRNYRFCNVYRKLDRHSKHILSIMENPQFTTYAELIERVLIFRFFNKVETYESIEASLGTYDFKTHPHFVFKLIDLRRSGKPLFASFYHPKQKSGSTMEEVVAEQTMTLFRVLDTVSYLEEVLTEQDTDNWSGIFYDVLTNAGCTPRQAYQMMLDLIIPLDRIGGQTLSRRAEFHGISYASKQAIDALELMGIKGPWRTINRAIRALCASQTYPLDLRAFPYLHDKDGRSILLSVHDIEHSLSQWWKFCHIRGGGRGTLYVPYKGEK